MAKIDTAAAETENRSIYRHKQSEAKKTNEIHRYFDSSINLNFIIMLNWNDEDHYKQLFERGAMIAFFVSLILAIISMTIIFW